MQHNIPRYELNDSKGNTSFVFKTMEEIDKQQALEGIKDLPHRHNYYTILLSNTAEGNHSIDFSTYEIKAGSLFFVSPNQVHAVNLKANPTGFVFLFTDEFLQSCNISEELISDIKLFRDFTDNTPIQLPQEAEDIKGTIRQIEQWYRSNKQYRLDAIGSLLKLFFIQCQEYYTTDQSETHALESGKKLLRTFKSLVENEFKQKHKVKEYAEGLFITSGYLNEVVQKYMGISAKDYILSRLLTEAKRLAMFTDKTAKEISYELGFDDPSHFGKIFKQLAGSAFQEYKKSIAEGK